MTAPVSQVFASPLAELERHAAGGEAEAMLALAKGLFDDGQEERSLTLYAQAAQGGHGEAARQLAIRKAARAEGEDWTEVLDYITRAAILGHAMAQQELAVLAGQWQVIESLAQGEAATPELWNRLRAAVDMPAMLKTPTPRQVMKTPHVSVAAGMIPPHVCDWIIARAHDRLVRARVFDPVSGAGRDTVMRTNRDTRFSFEDLDLVQMVILRRIGAMTGFDFRAMEPTSVLHYQTGEQFRQHFDYLDPGAYAEEVKNNGQRVGTFLIYLNEGFDGGETFFPITSYKYKGKRGDALMFRNVTAAGAPDRLTLHAGLAPTRGEKWLFSQWIRERPKTPG